MKAHPLPPYLQRFFTERLGAQLKASPNTVASYRDTFRLLLRYAADRLRRPPTNLQVADIDADCWLFPGRHRNDARKRGSQQEYASLGDPFVLQLCRGQRTAALAPLSTSARHAGETP